jgi:hypothetical protein
MAPPTTIINPPMVARMTAVLRLFFMVPDSRAPYVGATVCDATAGPRKPT